MTDALCWDDLDLFGGELDDPLEELLQDCYHRLLEAPGSNIDDKARGYGLEGKLSMGAPAGTIATAVASGIETELTKDERVKACVATVTSTAKGEYRIEIQIVANEEKLDLVLVADGGGVRRVA